MLLELLSNDGFGLGERERDFPDSLSLSDPNSDLEGEVDMVGDLQAWGNDARMGFLGRGTRTEMFLLESGKSLC